MGQWPHVRPSGTWALLLMGPVLVGAVAVALILGPAAPASPVERPDTSLPTCAPGVQFLGFSESLDKTAFDDFPVTELSGITYNQRSQQYYAIADRGGTVPAHSFTLDVPVSGESLGTPSVVGVTVLKMQDGSPYNGRFFDGEGIAATQQQELLVASEGGASGAAGVQQPEVRRFSREGAELEALEVPARFLIGNNNGSFESLALEPSEQSLFTANERPLPAVGTAPADGQTAAAENRIRILRYEGKAGGYAPAEQFYYLTDAERAPGDIGVVELIALSKSGLLVMERGFVAGQGNTVRVYRVSLAGAEDVSDEPALDNPALTPLAKTLVVDLADCPDSGATIPPGATQPNALLDNFEAMTLGPHLPGGRRALLLVSDDNGAAVQTTRLVALAVPVASLAGHD